VLIVEMSKRLVQPGHEVHIYLFSGERTKLFNTISKDPLITVYAPKNRANLYSPCNIFKFKKHLNKQTYYIINVHLFPSFYWVAIAHWFSNSKIPLINTVQSSMEAMKALLLDSEKLRELAVYTIRQTSKRQ